MTAETGIRSLPRRGRGKKETTHTLTEEGRNKIMARKRETGKRSRGGGMQRWSGDGKGTTKIGPLLHR